MTLRSSLVREARKSLRRSSSRKYRSLTELVSEAVEEKLETIMGNAIVSTKTVSKEEATHMILDYLRKNPGVHYPSDLANSLGLDLDLVFEVTESLLRDQIVETRTTHEEVIEAH